ncbi:predicted protein [Histoplasma mississippiense (nom. inval.)]|uniref:predicted protein n=1 Tax=Ajellomyces capsulatus (strain NAm1 / WU24) TaxID=2059318 RepID=UPI000157C674|nr:predicted protein [Histoplasma mississippiense (nom. inval.)]EDN08816.1 predicted protein [Histoplasma mississippiense (nom. inval.)]
MSFRGSSRGRGGSATGANRGGSGFGGRGAFIRPSGFGIGLPSVKVDEVLGPINQVYFTIKPQEGIVATSFKSGDKFYIGGDKLLPLEKFLPKPKPPPGAPKPKKVGGAGRGAARGGRGGRGASRGGRGAPRGRGGAPGRGAPRGGRGGFTARGGSRGGFRGASGGRRF